MKTHSFLIAAALLLRSVAVHADDGAPEGWTTESPRAEIRPDFAWDASGGPDQDSLIIRADDREGLMGFWTRTIPIQGEKHYRFTVARIVWLDKAGGKPIPSPSTCG